MIKKDNKLHMPFAEWLWRMSEAEVPIQARGLATYAVLFKVTANEELAKLAGMDTRGLADKTYNKWKTFLRENGWVIIKVVTTGRVTTIEVGPALSETPVIFTDVEPRDLRKIEKAAEKSSAVPAVKSTSEDYEPGEKSTGQSYERAEEVTSENYVPTVKSTPQNVTSTDASRAPAPAQMESLRDSYSRENSSLTTPSLLEQGTAREGETEVSPGLFVNCETIRHDKFTISLTGIYMQLTGTVPMEQIKQIALGHAVSWATTLAEGRRVKNVPPDSPDNWIRASIRKQVNEDAVTDVRKKRMAGPGGSKRMSLDELSDGVDAAYDRNFFGKPKTPRLTHER